MQIHYDWLVIGAGPAGILAVGELLEKGENNIAWIDPEFAVGDFSSKWSSVSSNTTVELFLKTYQSNTLFTNWFKAKDFAINTMNLQDTCLLKDAAEPLQWLTQQLQKQISCYYDSVHCLAMENGKWCAQLEKQSSIYANNVILAQGAEPRSLSLDDIDEISLENALDKKKLDTHVNQDDTIAVFGSSHSAIIIIRHLLELGVKNVINFYREPLRYAKNMGDWTLYDNTGLKGNTAKWARENLHGALPKGLTRVLSDKDHMSTHLPLCNKAIYAVGFSRRQLKIEGLPNDYSYNLHNGIIAPGLFGLGIAFPEKTIDTYHNIELSVGLWKFVKYLKKVMPIWLNYGLTEEVKKAA